MRLGWLFAAFVLKAIPATAASFDCRDSSTPVERAICSDAALSKADEEMARIYSSLKQSRSHYKATILLNGQRKWIRSRNRLCSTASLPCLRRLYSERIRVLQEQLDNVVQLPPEEVASWIGVRDKCEFTEIRWPEAFSIYGVGYAHGRILDGQIDDSGSQATQFDVAVNSPDRPVALMLFTYEPSIWNITWTPGTRILAIVASGHHRQAVAGIPADTAVIVTTTDAGLCPPYSVRDEPGPEINAAAVQIFGRNVDRTYTAPHGKAVVGRPLKYDAKLITSGNISPIVFLHKNKPLAGLAGVNAAVAKGILRSATTQDAEYWGERILQLLPGKTLNLENRNDDRRVLMGPTGSNVYAIMKPFHIPAGLYSTKAVTFYLMEGVPFPSGTLGHSKLYDFNSMTCHYSRIGNPCPE